MQLQILATRDIKANVYGIPMFIPHIGMHIRSFGDECQREAKDNPFWMHPEDYELVHLGTYDDETAQFELFDLPKQLAVGSNYKR